MQLGLGMALTQFVLSVISQIDQHGYKDTIWRKHKKLELAPGSFHQDTKSKCFM